MCMSVLSACMSVDYVCTCSLYVYECVVCMYACSMCVHDMVPEEGRVILHHLRLKFHIAVNAWIAPGSSDKAANALNCRAISLTHYTILKSPL